ncbi:MAG: molybdenum cofactor guanylyltransferase [Methanoregula sp.]|nr:MAG: molybdenum cofactor guanylyltransferase [Methanoregula sp.]
MRSAVVLVGGEARRVNGQEKYFFMYEGKTFISRLIGSLSQVVDEIVLVARDPEQCSRFGHFEAVRCITDIRKGIGPVGGLHAGVLAAKGDLIFVAACDMPCINPDVVDCLFDLIGGSDAAIPCWNKEMYEPLHAVYLRSALLTYLKSHESRSLRDMVRNLKTVYVPVETLRRYDPALTTFTNINRLEELDQFNSTDTV